MRIGLFTDSYPPYINGVSTSVETLKNALEGIGHTVYVVTVGQDATTYDYDKDNHILRVPGIPIGLYDYRAASIYPVKVVNMIKSWNLDIVHSHTELCMGIFARLFAKQFGIPLVHTYHTMYKDYTYYISRNHKYFDLGMKKAVEYLSKFYCDNTANNFIVPTVKTYKLFREEYHYEKDIFIVPTGMDATRFKKENVDMDEVKKMRKSLGYKKNDFIAIFVGRMAQEKNVEFLLHAMRILKDKKKDNIKLLLVGDGPDKDKYESLMNELDISSTVKFVGRVPWVDTPIYYHLSDVVVTASVTETQGLTVVEGLASGLPAICINDSAFNSVVVGSFNGRIFDEEEELAEILSHISSDKKQLEVLAKQAVLTAEKFSVSTFAYSVVQVYNDAILKFDLKRKKSIVNRVKDFFRKRKGKKDEK